MIVLLLFQASTSYICVPDMIHHTGTSSPNGKQVQNSVNGSQQNPFTLSRHKKVDIPATSIFNHSQNAVRREPADLGIPYPPGKLCFPIEIQFSCFPPLIILL